MKESIDDRITKRIKEVMEQYEPDYSPQDWEKLRKQLPVPEFWFKRLLLKYKFWVSDIAMIGVLGIVYYAASVLPEDKDSAVDTQFPETANYALSEEPKGITYSGKSTVLSISEAGNSLEEKNRSSGATTVLMTDSRPPEYQGYIHPGNTVSEMHESIEINPVIPGSLNETDFGYQENNSQLIPIKYRAEEIPVLKSTSYEKKGKSKFQWPEFNSLFTKEEGYDKFTGPNKLALFYSPEMLHTDSLETLGVSHGVGISFEGPIRSAISISVGLSYQTINFHKTIFLEKVLPPDIPEYIDSIGITSGSYKYLEIPVSLNFKFFENSRSQVWSGIGISSIVFLKQDYATETVVGGISDQVSSSAKAWENILPVASLNLSLLYKHQFSDRIFLHSSVQYKIHLVPLGYISMKLNRLNLQIGLIYSLGRKH